MGTKKIAEALARAKEEATEQQECEVIEKRREQLEVFVARFGFCGCKDRCQQEEYSDLNFQNKPNGRFSVCKLEAEKHGIEVPEKEDEE